MNSPKYVNYETRPLKFTERKMLLASLLRICNYYDNEYQYVGFGGLAFSDFKLFHKELHINDLYSIEGGGFHSERLDYNSPYSFVQILKTNSTDALNQIDLTKKTFIWLDYDGALDNYMFDDIRAIFSKMPEGSIYLISCNRELKDNKSRTEYTKTQFKSKFGNLVPFNIENIDFSNEKSSSTIRRMLLEQIHSIVNERNLVEDSNLEFKQLFNIHYQENRGAKIFTFGGVISKKGTQLQEIGLNAFHFICETEDCYNIQIPNITRKEIELIEKHLLNKEVLLTKNIISESDYNKYEKVYKYVPHFYDIRV